MRYRFTDGINGHVGTMTLIQESALTTVEKGLRRPSKGQIDALRARLDAIDVLIAATKDGVPGASGVKGPRLDPKRLTGAPVVPAAKLVVPSLDAERQRSRTILEKMNADAKSVWRRP